MIDWGNINRSTRTQPPLTRGRSGALLTWAALAVIICAVTLALLARPTPSGVTYDRAVLAALNHAFAQNPQAAQLQMTLFNTDLAEMVLVVGLVVLWSVERVRGFDQARLRRRALLACAACIPAYLMCRLVQKLGDRPRPLVSVPLDRFVSPEAWAGMQANWTRHGSFPSDHAALSAVAIVVAFSINRRAGWFFAIFGAYTALVRIAIGYHWPSDVAGGFIAGTVAASLGLLLAPKLRPLLDRVLVQFSRKPVFAYPLAFVFLAEFGHGFLRINQVAHDVLHARLFH